MNCKLAYVNPASLQSTIEEHCFVFQRNSCPNEDLDFKRIGRAKVVLRCPNCGHLLQPLCKHQLQQCELISHHRTEQQSKYQHQRQRQLQPHELQLLAIKNRDTCDHRALPPSSQFLKRFVHLSVKQMHKLMYDCLANENGTKTATRKHQFGHLFLLCCRRHHHLSPRVNVTVCVASTNNASIRSQYWRDTATSHVVSCCFFLSFAMIVFFVDVVAVIAVTIAITIIITIIPIATTIIIIVLTAALALALTLGLAFASALTDRARVASDVPSEELGNNDCCQSFMTHAHVVVVCDSFRFSMPRRATTTLLTTLSAPCLTSTSTSRNVRAGTLTTNSSLSDSSSSSNNNNNNSHSIANLLLLRNDGAGRRNCHRTDRHNEHRQRPQTHRPRIVRMRPIKTTEIATFPYGESQIILQRPLCCGRHASCGGSVPLLSLWPSSLLVCLMIIMISWSAHSPSSSSSFARALEIPLGAATYRFSADSSTTTAGGGASAATGGASKSGHLYNSNNLLRHPYNSLFVSRYCEWKSNLFVPKSTDIYFAQPYVPNVMIPAATAASGFNNYNNINITDTIQIHDNEQLQLQRIKRSNVSSIMDITAATSATSSETTFQQSIILRLPISLIASTFNGFEQACAIRLIVPPNYRISAKIFSRRLEFAQYLDQVPELGVSQLWVNVSQNHLVEASNNIIESPTNVLAFRFLIDRYALKQTADLRFHVILTAFRTFDPSFVWDSTSLVCDNNHVISSELACDGYKNCEDGHDEDISACTNNANKLQAYYLRGTNFYANGGSFSWITILVLSLILLLVLTLVGLYYCNRQGR